MAWRGNLNMLSPGRVNDVFRAALAQIRGASGISLELLGYTVPDAHPVLVERDTHAEWRELNGPGKE